MQAVWYCSNYCICHRCQSLGDTGGAPWFANISTCFWTKFRMILMLFSEDWGKMIHEKNLKQKISWHCPLNKYLSCLSTVLHGNLCCKYFQLVIIRSKKGHAETQSVYVLKNENMYVLLTIVCGQLSAERKRLKLCIFGTIHKLYLRFFSRDYEGRLIW